MIRKIRFVMMIAMLLLVGCSSLNSAKNTVSSLATQQLMVQAFLMDGEKLMASPRIITMNGEKAQIDMRTVAAPVPGQAQRVASGLQLVVQPKIQEGRIVFNGRFLLKESLGKLDQVDLHTATFHTREAFFSGVANSGEIKLVALEAANDRPLELRLKFILMVNTSQATKTH